MGRGFKPGRDPRELQVSTALCLSLLSTLFPLRPEVLPPYVLSCPSPASPTCSSQSRGDTGLCPGTLAAVGPLGTCTPVDGVKVDFVETCSAALVLCLQPCCVHVCLLCMGGTLLVSVLGMCRVCSSAFHQAHSRPPLFPLSAVPSNFLRLVLGTETGVAALPQHIYANFL